MSEEKYFDPNPITPFEPKTPIPEDILDDFKLVYTIEGTEIYSTHRIPEDYAKMYLDRTKKRFLPQTKILGLYLQFHDESDPEELRDVVNCWHFRDPKKFERIRRITGYLVGTLDRFNDAKRAEESQRVKHGVGNY